MNRLRQVQSQYLISSDNVLYPHIYRQAMHRIPMYISSTNTWPIRVWTKKIFWSPPFQGLVKIPEIVEQLLY